MRYANVKLGRYFESSRKYDVAIRVYNSNNRIDLVVTIGLY